MLQLGVDIDSVRFNLKGFMGKERKHDGAKNKPPVQLEHSDAFKRVIQRAIFHTQTLGSSEVSGGRVLAGILSETDSHAFYILHEEGSTRSSLINCFQRIDQLLM